MKISNIVSITSCVNAIPLHIFIHLYDFTTKYVPYDFLETTPTIPDDVSDNPNCTVTVANSALPSVEDTTVKDTTAGDTAVEETSVTPTTDTPAYYEFTTTTHDFDHSTESGWSTSIPAHQCLYGVDAPLPPYRPNEKTLKQRAAKAQEEISTSESTTNSFSQCNIL